MAINKCDSSDNPGNPLNINHSDQFHPGGLLKQGWRTFARAQRLETDQILRFRYNGQRTLFVVVYGFLDGRVECCSEGCSKEVSSGEDDSYID